MSQLFSFEGKWMTLDQIQTIKEKLEEENKQADSQQPEIKEVLANEEVLTFDTPVGEVEVSSQALEEGEKLSEDEKEEIALKADPIQEVFAQELTRDEMKALLKEKGIAFKGNASNDKLKELIANRK